MQFAFELQLTLRAAHNADVAHSELSTCLTILMQMYQDNACKLHQVAIVCGLSPKAATPSRKLGKSQAVRISCSIKVELGKENKKHIIIDTIDIN